MEGFKIPNSELETKSHSCWQPSDAPISRYVINGEAVMAKEGAGRSLAAVIVVVIIMLSAFRETIGADPSG